MSDFGGLKARKVKNGNKKKEEKICIEIDINTSNK